MPQQHTVQRVRQSVASAFAEATRPSGHDLAPHECDECEQIRGVLGSYHFNSLPNDVLDWFADSLPLLGPKGLNYYLPAYMFRALSNPDWGRVDLLIYHLGPTKTDISKQPKYWADRVEIFSQDQRRAILAFISWLATTAVGQEYPDEISRALSLWRPEA
jgi:hypothetical protein